MREQSMHIIPFLPFTIHGLCIKIIPDLQYDKIQFMAGTANTVSTNLYIFWLHLGEYGDVD